MFSCVLSTFCEIGIQLANWCNTNNNIKVVVPHCGAYLPLSIPRMKLLTSVMQANKMVDDIDYEANLRTLYYDLAGAHSTETIRMLLTITTPDHLLYGSDYPYVAPQVWG